MSAFNKCKDCGEVAPPSGWQTSSKSLCKACAAQRAPKAEAQSFVDPKHAAFSDASMALAMLAGMAIGRGRPRGYRQ